MSLVLPLKQLLTRYGAKTMKPVIILAISFVLLIPNIAFGEDNAWHEIKFEEDGNLINVEDYELKAEQ